MGLTNALRIGQTGLTANQAAIEIAGNNLANMATEGYHRQTVTMSPLGADEMARGLFIGRGVQVQSINRVINEALEHRVRNGISDEANSLTRKDVLAQVEAIHNELGDQDLSSYLNAFFNAWSELANRPEDLSLRTLAVEQAESLASFTQNLRNDLNLVRDQLDAAIGQAATQANDILERIEELNTQIVQAEKGTRGAHGLRDERDQLLTELSELITISANEQPTGVIDIFVGSTPIMLGGKSRGLEVVTQTINDDLDIRLVVADDQTRLNPRGGKLGALITARSEDVNGAIEELDGIVHELIYEVNKIQSTGQGQIGYNSLISKYSVNDPAVALTDPLAEMYFEPQHGSFKIHVTQKSSGVRTTSLINVDLDGIGADTTLNTLAADLNLVGNVTATVLPDGRLRLDGASNDIEITFSEDSSGVLAALGINSFFTGKNAYDIAVNTELEADPRLVAATNQHQPGDNSNALLMAQLKDRALTALTGQSLNEAWRHHVEEYAIRYGQQAQQNESDQVVLESLRMQQQAISGVNVDEESINLLAFQRAYQGSARFITVVDEMFQTLLGIV